MQPLRPIVSADPRPWRDGPALLALCLAGAFALWAIAPSDLPADAAGAGPPPAPRDETAPDDADAGGAQGRPAPLLPAPARRASPVESARRSASRRELPRESAPAAPPPAPQSEHPPAPSVEPPSGDASEGPSPEPPAPTEAGAGAWSITRSGRVELPGAEIVAFDPASRSLFVTCAAGLAQIDLSDSGAATIRRTIDLRADAGLPGAGTISHVAIDPAGRGFFAATLIPADHSAMPGHVVLAPISGAGPARTFTVGFGPDALAFTDDGSRLIVLNEGEPAAGAAALTADPPGSVSIISLDGVTGLSDLASDDRERIRTVMLAGPLVERAIASDGLRIHPSRATSPTLDLEPESVAISGRTAYVTLQENNGVAAIDLDSAQWTLVRGLGAILQTIDASDTDGAGNISAAVECLPCPDGVACFTLGPRRYLVTANEGDSRGEVGSGPLAPDRAPTVPGPQALGSRSVSVWDADTLTRVGDTGSALEWLMASQAPEWFNADFNGAADSRSDERGPEPECVAVWARAGGPIAFASLERPGAIAIVDLSRPDAPRVVHLHVSAPEGDFGPEGLTLIDAAQSPTGKPLLAGAYEASGTVAVYQIADPN